MSENLSDFFSKLPSVSDGWTKADQFALYTPENLSTYIDGGAELYLSYNFQSALSLKYIRAAENEITVDIFKMGSSYDAFGVFAHCRETSDNRIGQGSEYVAGLLTFWQDNYYVSILAYPENEEKKQLVFKLGQAIAKAIKNEGPLPPIIALLPQENLIRESVRYFHHYIWLNSFYFVANENILNITTNTPASLAKYRNGGGTFFLLLVIYPDQQQAQVAQSQFLSKQLPGATAGMMAMKDGTWTGCQLQGNLLSAIFHAPNEQTIRTMFARINIQ